MMEVMKDRLGNQIKVGSRVAYNLSGEVALGTVARIRPGEQNTVMHQFPRWRIRPLIFVKPDAAWNRVASAKGESKLEIWDSPGNPIGKVLVIDA